MVAKRKTLMTKKSKTTSSEALMCKNFLNCHQDIVVDTTIVLFLVTSKTCKSERKKSLRPANLTLIETKDKKNHFRIQYLLVLGSKPEKERKKPVDEFSNTTFDSIEIGEKRNSQCDRHHRCYMIRDD
ncbi:hypothetical protein DERF_009109 [Dermatophagoides farinae]|uniref:Uncharacterized protein n=1 Tax=Dermatophagoides farinae TaxID=6954 RepID=A0A922HTC2_DERFA|nr:hypothetical protein DERF_009109 [Dermatophagoides farinae]KAH9510588.1 hypothetical protein DERF_009109 [Dermatophagoides farinae]